MPAKKKPHAANSPWRRGPACDTKRAHASYMRYRKAAKSTEEKTDDRPPAPAA